MYPRETFDDLKRSLGFAAVASYHPSECSVCGARSPHVSISKTGKCPDHSVQRMSRNLVSLHTKSGPDYERWLRNLARSLVEHHKRLDAARDQG